VYALHVLPALTLAPTELRHAQHALLTQAVILVLLTLQPAHAVWATQAQQVVHAVLPSMVDGVLQPHVLPPAVVASLPARAHALHPPMVELIAQALPLSHAILKHVHCHVQLVATHQVAVTCLVCPYAVLALLACIRVPQVQQHVFHVQQVHTWPQLVLQHASIVQYIRHVMLVLLHYHNVYAMLVILVQLVDHAMLQHHAHHTLQQQHVKHKLDVVHYRLICALLVPMTLLHA